MCRLKMHAGSIRPSFLGGKKSRDVTLVFALLYKYIWRIKGTVCIVLTTEEETARQNPTLCVISKLRVNIAVEA